MKRAAAQSNPSADGAWSPVFQLNSITSGPIVGIHMSLLPNGRVLVFTRQQDPVTGNDNVEGFSRTYVWDPASNSVISEPFNSTQNVFCGGHAFFHDGRLLATGGHKAADSRGELGASFYDWNTNAWGAAPSMGRGRWYPTNVALGNSEMLVDSGADENFQFNDQPQVWQADNTWRTLSAAPDPHRDFYPWLHLAPNGQVFHSGPGQATQYLRTSGTGLWTFVANSGFAGGRDHGSSVTYDDGKVLIMGGGGDEPGTLPRRDCEMINLNVSPAISTTQTSVAPAPQWRRVGDMGFGRRQLNAVLLPDGTVLATGGSNANSSVEASGAVLAAEIYDPDTEVWSTKASMDIPRLYHSTALLLPDGRVMSAGGGFPPSPGSSNQPNYQLYSPPYLFKGPRPTIGAAPSEVALNTNFFITTPDAASISKVTMIRLGSVTHAYDQNQRMTQLIFRAQPGGLEVQFPGGANLTPSGHYMLFLVNSNGVPSVASIVKISHQTTGSNSIDDARYFVRMHYQDFLERDPINANDRPGLVFWSRQITQCGNDAACRDAKRRDVSDAFWESGDFRARADVIADGLVNPPGSATKYNNHQFIRYCYRIYLRREPDAGGWAFWENSLNQDNDYKRLERNFLVSPEYRDRFHKP
ncbi:MAG TPA: galactose oxidase-like domain-containing protein [Pyrinomonadaceae bacterium]|jgi:hypothetical protein